VHEPVLGLAYFSGLFLLFLMFFLSIIEASHARIRLVMERHELSREIAERKHAEEELKKGARKYRLIVENVSDIVWAMDFGGYFTFVSPSVERILGYTPKQFLSTQMGDLFTPQSYEEALKEINDRLATDHERAGRLYRPKAREFELLHKDGPKIICECTSLFLRDETGQPTGIIGVARDITERKRAERAIIQSSRMEATATLAGGIAHDFNNLMTTVLGNAELLRSDFEDRPDVREILTVIANSAKKAGELSQQMLAYAQGGKYISKIANLNETIRKVIRSAREKVIDRIEIGHDLEEDLWMVESDPVQMNQVLLALITNAVESIEETGRIYVTSKNVDVGKPLIEKHPFLKPGRHICISVEDTGCGMEKKTLSRVFEPFFSTKFQGRGMGLAAAYGIVKNHEGCLVASSVPGQGSTFSIYLPIVEVPVEEEVPRGFISSQRGATVLVVEDDELVLDMTQSMLGHLGHRSLLARNGKEAVEVARTFEDDIHIAWLDLEMPVMDGAAALPLLQEARPNMKVVLCSGYDLDVTARRLLAAGAHSFVRKPFTTEILDREIQMALRS
jgi:PAS domain S-box-containing protein